MDKLWFVGVNGDYYDNYNINKASEITTGFTLKSDDEIREFASKCSGIEGEVENISVEQLLKAGYKISAVRLCYEIGTFSNKDFTLTDAKRVVDELEKKLKEEEENNKCQNS